jgi:inosine-uridine nucleoside N-ribohydrolase
MVYNAPDVKISSIGLDVTTQVVMEKDEIIKNFTGKILQPVLDFSGVWFQDSRQITFHDPLAAATIFDDTLCGFEKGRVEVELAGNRTMGLTWLNPEEDGPHEVALRVDAERFFSHYFDVTNKN